MYRITVLGWPKKEEEERKKMNNSDLQLFQVCHFKIVTTLCYYYCRLGQALKLFYVLLDASICSMVMISPCKHYYIDWNHHLVLRPSLQMGYATVSP